MSHLKIDIKVTVDLKKKSILPCYNTTCNVENRSVSEMKFTIYIKCIYNVYIKCIHSYELFRIKSNKLKKMFKINIRFYKKRNIVF